MTQKEFEERTGLKMTPDGFEEVNETYMNTDIDKDLFCELWVNNPAALKEIEVKTRELRKLQDMKNDVVRFLANMAEETGDRKVREKAVRIIGMKRYLCMKLGAGYDLWEDEREAVTEALLRMEGDFPPPPLSKFNRETRAYAKAAGMTEEEAAALLREAEAEKKYTERLINNELLDGQWKGNCE